ncbi:Mrp/NBP35 family ATP-binding protein [Sphingomonas jatrophae]|uniref:Iron-sulfur cluster carrier protein n=1 Tax=Sphingomonas jatrophae TaxID=1166337 RepID=A0A1I6LD09_9SPHN|nr:Mrp/NBP35 family ATP-binding protein [Sphingomonas jatrophae]SFS01323.1 ATP-binding protein involved in chromosome partitioning [Sphingomonas jatrophae]
MIDLQLLHRALDALPDPVTGRGLVAAGRAAPPTAQGPVARATIDVTGLSDEARTALEGAARAALAAVPGVGEVRLLLTAERVGRTLLAVASGKGGVGKSTVSANLAVALARMGVSVGLIDADIYGPSQPRLLGTEGEKPTADKQRMNPVMSRFGVPMLSMGMLVPPGQAIAWRGPMAGNALGQLVDADWGATRLLILDLPPGTGDVQLTMVQKHKPGAALIVSTPQDLALIDATRAIDLFRKATVPVLGLVENMAGYACPHCGEISDPFGRGGAEAAAATMDLPFLGRVPLEIAIRTASDAGEPPAAQDGPVGAPFHALAAKVAAAMNLTAAGGLNA